MTRALWLAALGCATEPLDSPIRDVRPPKVEIGETLVIEGRGFLPGAQTKVVLQGPFKRPGRGEPDVRAVELAARAVDATRVHVDADAAMERAIGRADFLGAVKVVQGDRVLAPPPGVVYEIKFFPRSLRGLTFGLLDARKAARLSEWLGLGVRDAQGAEPGAEVVSVVRALHADALFDRFEAPPFNARITREELGGHAAEFAWLDADSDGEITRHEADEGERADGHAARAGLRPGDLVVAAAGRPVAGARDFFAAWEADVARVDLRVRRGEETVALALPRHGAEPALPDWMLAAGGPFAAALLLFLLIGPFSGLVVVAERRISGQMQSRIGPNRVGPQGLLQWLADALKMLTKEDVVPDDADPALFRLSPYLVWMAVFGTFVVLPFSQSVIVADLNIGILYLLSITSLAVVGVIMGGWASNSKWSLLGGMRSAAQILSYEIPASMALLSVIVLAGSLSPQYIVQEQGGAPWNWHVFHNPFAFACFFMFFISALAEGNRTPFDLPEAESELVSGYNTEYSGFRFGVYFLAEWTNLYVIAAVATTVFLGGWRLPGVTLPEMEANLRPGQAAFAAVGAALVLIGVGAWIAGRALPHVRKLLWVVPLVGAALLGSMAAGYQLLGFVVFFLKALALVFVIIWIRWTLPRFRVDQMMSMCWHYFVPLTFACFLGIAAWLWLAPPWLKTGMRLAMFLTLGVGLSAWFVTRVAMNLRNHPRRLWDPFTGTLTPPAGEPKKV